VRKIWTYSFSDPVAIFCEHCDEPSDSIRSGHIVTSLTILVKTVDGIMGCILIVQ
jgi:hypothetical protein